jgi:predicted Na+-dependent transporter
MPSADRVPVISPHSMMHWHEWVVPIAGSTGSALHAVRLGIGWLLGGPSADTKRVVALGTGQRNIAAALVVASQSFNDAKVVVMVIVVAIVGLIVLMPLSRALASLKT